MSTYEPQHPTVIHFTDGPLAGKTQFRARAPLPPMFFDERGNYLNSTKGYQVLGLQGKVTSRAKVRRCYVHDRDEIEANGRIHRYYRFVDSSH
jgi:hypothetical protein